MLWTGEDARAISIIMCISEAQDAVSELAILQDQAILDCYCGGTSHEPLPACLPNSDTEFESGEEENLSSCESECGSMKDFPDEQALSRLLCDCEYNWFQFIEQVELS